MSSGVEGADPTASTTAFVLRISESHQKLVDEQLAHVESRIVGVEREAQAHREGIAKALIERLDAIDKATDLLATDLRQVPTDLQIAISSVKELEAVKFGNISDRFEQSERQTAREKAAADLALAAAFDAQKEAAAATNNANAEAIRKSELATTETIKTNAESQRAGQQSLADKIDDMKDRMNRLESLIIALQTQRSTTHEGRTDTRADRNLAIVAIGTVIGFIAVIVAIYGLKP